MPTNVPTMTPMYVIRVSTEGHRYGPKSKRASLLTLLVSRHVRADDGGWFGDVVRVRSRVRWQGTRGDEKANRILPHVTLTSPTFS
jgi:hypothetical protein